MRLDTIDRGGQHRLVALPAHLLEMIVCPESRAPLLYFAGGERGDQPEQAFLYCPTSQLRYPIEGDIPVLIVDEATKVDPTEAARLTVRARELGLVA